MKKIFFDGIIYSLQKTGGISVYFNELLSRLDRDKYDYLLSFYNVNIQISSKNLIPQNYRAFERYRKTINIPTDCKIFHSTYYRIPKNKNIKIVSTIHDFTYEKFSSGLKKTIHANQKINAIDLSDQIICVSNNTKNDLLKFYPQYSDKKIHVIYNGVSSDYHQIKMPEIGNSVLFIGSRSGYKNFYNAIVALSNFKSLNLVIVGGGEINTKEKIFLNYFLKGRWNFMGNLSNSNLNKIYNKVKFLIHPSLYEGFGITLLEASLAKCPIVAVATPATKEIFNSNLIEAPDGTPESISDSISKLLKNYNRDLLTKKTFDISQNFTWEKTYKKTCDVYKSL